METEEGEKEVIKQQEVVQNTNQGIYQNISPQEAIQNASQAVYQNTNQEEVTATAIVKKSKAKLIVLICIIVIIIAGGIAGYIYYMQINKPINKFAKLSNQFFSAMVSQFSSEGNDTSDKLATILNGKFSADMKLSANISDLNLDDMLSASGLVDSNSASNSGDGTSMSDNIKNQIGNYEVNLTYEKDKQNKEQLLNMSYTDKTSGQTYNPYEVFNSGDNYGISLSEVYNKILTFTKTDLTDNGMEDVATAFDSMLNMNYSTTTKSSINWFTSDEINTILNNLKPVYNKYFTDDKFTEQKNINENKDSQITVTMTEADFGNFVKDTLSILKDNEDVKNIIANKVGLTNDYSTYDSTLSNMIDEVTQTYSSTSENITMQVIYNDNTVKSITFNFSEGSILITQSESGTFGIVFNDTTNVVEMGITLKKNNNNDYTMTYIVYGPEDKMNISLGIKWDSQIVNNSAVNMVYTITPSYSLESLDGNMSFAGQLNANVTFVPIDKVEIPDTSTNSASVFDENTQTDLMTTIEDLATNNPDEFMKKLPILGWEYVLSVQIFQDMYNVQNAQDTYNNSINEENDAINNFQQSMNDILNNYDNNSIDENNTQ
ncbi:MAG: hypothetical protein FWF46_02910 [Oscillospiraceae bacterium]|nr:hypothetical protein [Oscillospiraceae bacterium]